MKAINKKNELETEIVGLIQIKDRIAICTKDPKRWTLISNPEDMRFDDGYGNELPPVDQSAENFLTPDGECVAGDKDFNDFIVSISQSKPKKKKSDKN